MTLAAVSFDAHHTLLHAPRLGAIYAEVLARHGIAFTAAELAAEMPRVWREFSCRRRLGADRFASHPGGSLGFWQEFVERLCARLGGERPTRFAVAELYDRLARAEAWELYPEVPGVLAALAERRLRVGLVSNFDQRLRAILDRLGIAGAFEVVVVSAEVGVEKPHPEIFGILLDGLGLPAERVLHVGDSRRDDLEGAEGVGMPALLIDREGRSGDLRRLDELLGRLGPEAVW